MTALLFQTCTLLCHQNLLFGVTTLFLYFSSADACFLSYFVFPVRLLGSRSSPSVVSTFGNRDLLITFINQQQFKVLQMTRFWILANIFHMRLTRKQGGKPQMCIIFSSCYELQPIKTSLNFLLWCDLHFVWHFFWFSVIEVRISAPLPWPWPLGSTQSEISRLSNIVIYSPPCRLIWISNRSSCF